MYIAVPNLVERQLLNGILKFVRPAPLHRVHSNAPNVIKSSLVEDTFKNTSGVFTLCRGDGTSSAKIVARLLNIELG